eukprot:Sspe_Gene.43162::Locus_21000_Transcript_1_4_Confidence_0.375_Length_2634::g.43162::m.43162/K15361/WDR48, UAF1; WD repeat-containing protein 48
MESRRRARRITYTIGRRAASGIVGSINTLLPLQLGDGSHVVASGGRDGVVRVWSNTVEECEENGGSVASHGTRPPSPSLHPPLLASFDEHLDWVNDLCHIPTSSHTLVASCSSDSQVKVWSLDEKRCKATVCPHYDYAKKLVWSDALGKLISGSFDGSLCAIDVEASMGGKSAVRVAELHQSVYSLASQGSLLAAGTTDTSIRIIDCNSSRVSNVLSGHKDMIRDLVWVAPEQLLSCSSDGTMRMWDVRMERTLLTLVVHRAPVWRLCEAAPGLVLSGSRDGTVFLTGEHTHPSERQAHTACVLVTPGSGIHAMAVAGPPGRELLWTASGNTDDAILLWNLGPLIPRKTAPEPSRSPLCSTLTVHNMCPSHLDRHTFTLPHVHNTPYMQLLSPSGKSAKQLDEDERVKAMSFANAAGIALSTPMASCHAYPPIVVAKVLDNRRHCLTKDSHGEMALWDLTTARLCETYPAGDFSKKVEDLTNAFPKVALGQWCTIDLSTGSVVVCIDYPSGFLCETTLWEKDSHSPLVQYPQRLSHEALVLAKEEPSINMGESVLLGLFYQIIPSHYRVLVERGDLPLDGKKRRAWLDGEYRHQRNAGLGADVLARVQFSLPDDTPLAVWDRRSVPSSRHNPPDKGAPAFVAEREVLQEHTNTTVGEVATTFTSIENHNGKTQRVVNARMPRWVLDMIDRHALPQSKHQLSFYLRSDDRDLPDLQDKLMAAPRVRLFKLAREVVRMLKLRLPTVQEWEDPNNSEGPLPNGSDTILPEEYIQILSESHKVLDPLSSLATVDKHFRKGRELVVLYKRTVCGEITRLRSSGVGMW